MSDEELRLIVEKAVRKLNGRLPLGVMPADAIQDGYVEALEWAQVTPKDGVAVEAWMVMKVWGSLKDKYARDFQKAGLRRAVEQANWDRQPVTNRDIEQAEGPIPLNPRVQLAPGDGSEADTILDVRAAIEKLPEPKRTMVLMELDGADHATIGACLDLSRSWVSRSITAAKEELKQLLAEGYA